MRHAPVMLVSMLYIQRIYTSKLAGVMFEFNDIQGCCACPVHVVHLRALAGVRLACRAIGVGASTLPWMRIGADAL